MTAYRADYAQHAKQLADAFRVALCIENIPPEQARALRETKDTFIGAVLISPIIDETTYAVALHEMGHVVSAVGSLAEKQRATSALQQQRYTLLEEQAAWDWAEHYACDWTPAMAALRQWAEGSYQQRYTHLMAQAPTQTHVDTSTAGFAKRLR